MRAKVQPAHQNVVTDYSRYLVDNKFLMLLFHGVVPAREHAVRNYINKHIVVDKFVVVLRRLLETGTAVSLEDVVSASRGECQLPERSFAVTFDDGFANNYSVAVPILRDLKVPATFFITTDFVDRNTASWVDMVEEVVESIPVVRVDLPEYSLSGEYCCVDDKIELLKKIRSIVYGDGSIEPYKFAEEFREHVDGGEFKPDVDLDQKMNWQQIGEINDNDLFTIGGHSHTHPILARLDDEELAWEIDKSLTLLEKSTGEAVKHYSYPQGLDWCYSDRVIEALKERGIVCCPTAEEGVNRVGDDLFRLKRIMVT